MAQPPEGSSCEGHTHYSVALINEVYNYNVDKMFALVFSDSNVQQTLSKLKNKTDVVWHPWQLDPDGYQRRDVTYVVTVPHQSKPFQFTEKQAVYPESKPGICFVVDTECISLTVPYGDSFSVVARSYISQVSDDRCHLCMTCEISFHKSLFGPVKSLITDMATDNISKHFRTLAELLRKEDPGFEKSDSEHSLAPVEEPVVEVISESFQDTSFFLTGIIYFVFTLSILCLVCITGALFYGLWGSLDRMSFGSARELPKQRMLRQNNEPHVYTIADDLVAQLSELLASATKLIETTSESIEELTERESKLEKRRQQLQQEEKEEEEEMEEEEMEEEMKEEV